MLPGPVRAGRRRAQLELSSVPVVRTVTDGPDTGAATVTPGPVLFRAVLSPVVVTIAGWALRARRGPWHWQVETASRSACPLAGLH